MISFYCPLNILLVTGCVSGMKTDMTGIANNMLIHFDLQLKNCHLNVIKWFQGECFFQLLFGSVFFFKWRHALEESFNHIFME